MEIYDIGDLVRVSAAFDVDEAPTDPTALTLAVTSPSGTAVTYIYGTDPEIVRDGPGRFHADLAPDAAGLWAYRWTGTGAAVASQTGYYAVRTPVGTARTAWPNPADVLDRLNAAGVTLRDSATAGRIQGTLMAVIAEVGNRTQRQFLADLDDTTRYYDGSGTPELEVDEMVSLTGVGVIGYLDDPGWTLSGVVLAEDQERPRTRLIAGRGDLPAYWPYAGPFPAGRQNIAVTGIFGYAATIPADLWEAVAGEAAGRMAREGLFSSTGKLVEAQQADVRYKYQFATTVTSVEGLDPVVSLGWNKRFEQVIQQYRRPPGRKFRKMRNAMV